MTEGAAAQPEQVDCDYLTAQLSVQNFRPIRGQLYRALAELKTLRRDPRGSAMVEWMHRADAAEARAVRAERELADLREQSVDIEQVHMDIDEGVGPTLSHRDELELLAVNLEIALQNVLSDHWQTRDTWGGEMRDVCGRCTYGDGVPFLWPCPTRRAVTGEPDPSAGSAAGEPT
jgi:hypothetical protein